MINYYSWTYDNNLSRMGKTAVYAGDYEYSFKDIFDMADAVADHFSGLGLHDGDFILASMMPSPESIAVMLACAKLDICCMSLVPGVNDERLLSFIKAEGVRYAFIEEVFLDALFGVEQSVEALETVFAMPHDIYQSEGDRLNIDYAKKFSFVRKWDDFMSGTATPSAAVSEPHSPVYIAAAPDHDNPKGIMYSHDAMIAAAKLFVATQQNMKPGMIMHSRIPMFATAGNSMETMSPFASGLAVATGQIIWLDGKCVPVEFEKYKPNCFMMAKTSILQAMENPIMADIDFSGLVSFYSFGEPLSEEEKSKVGEFFLSRGARTTVRNAYGLSESNCILTAEEPSTEMSSTAGRPVPGVSLMIVDPDTLEEVEPGKPGEIIYSVACMMDGYFKNEEATSKRLFKNKDGKVYDRTGDLGCLDGDGNLHILGRTDERYRNDKGQTRYFFEIQNAVQAVSCFDSAYLVSADGNVYIHYTGSNTDKSQIAALRNKLIQSNAYHSGHFFLRHWDELPTSGGRVRSFLLTSHTEGAVSVDEY